MILTLPNQKNQVSNSKSQWQRKPLLNTDHDKYTIEFFMSNLFFSLLGLENQIFALIFWTKRCCNHSYRELEVDLSHYLKQRIFRQTLIPMINIWVSLGFVIKKRQYRYNRKGKKTKAFWRNYYVLTPLGKLFMEVIIHFAMYGVIPEGSEIPELKICGTVVKTPQNFMKRDWKDVLTKNTLTNRYLQKYYHHEYFLSGRRKKSQGKCSFLIEVIEKASKWFVLVKCSYNSDPPVKKKTLNFTNSKEKPLNQGYLHPWFNKQKTFKNDNLFKELGLEKEYDASDSRSKMFWAKQSPDQMKKVLKLFLRKHVKGQRIQSFERFISHLVKAEGKNFFEFKAKEMRVAVDGNITQMALGVDSQAVAELIRELEKSTGEKVSDRTMARIIRQPTQKLRKALEGVKFRTLGKSPAKTKNGNSEQRKSIYRQKLVMEKVKIYNPKTGKDEIREIKKRVKMIVGYETEKPQQEKTPIKKYVPVKSWIGLLMFALKMDSIEEINEKFFKKQPINEKAI